MKTTQFTNKRSHVVRKTIKTRTKKIKLKTIRKIAKILNIVKSSIIETFVFQLIRVKQKRRNSSRSSFSSFSFSIEIFLNDDEKSMNITMIDVVFYVKLINFKNRRKNIKLFFITLKKIHTALNKYKNLSIKKVNSMKINALMKKTMKKLFEKILEFLRKFVKILNSKKIEIFFFVDQMIIK